MKHIHASRDKMSLINQIYFNGEKWNTECGSLLNMLNN